MKIIVGFSYQNKILSKLIRMTTKSNVSHTYIRGIYNVGEMLIHAHGLDVNFTTFSKFRDENIVVSEYNVDVSERELFWLSQQVGKRYGMMTLIGFFFVLVLQFFGKQIKNPFNDGSKTFICSELVARTLDLHDPENITPGELRDYLERKKQNG